jgi:hypothetical protein
MELLADQGFTRTSSVESSLTWKDIRSEQTGGQHGTGELGRAMGPVSGFVLRADGEPTIYIAGGACFTNGDPITMTANDITSICRHMEGIQIVAVHLEAINHCLETRAMLRERLAEQGFLNRVSIPEDGDWV